MKRWRQWGLVALMISSLFAASAAKAETVLRLNGVNLDYIGDFRETHADIYLSDGDYRYYETTDELLCDLQSGAFPYDVFEISNSRMDCRLLMEEGYCLDLSASEIIRGAMETLHPVFAAQCMLDGRIYAIPHTVQLNYMGISQPVLAQSSMENAEVPDTFPEFLDFLEQWVAHLRENPEGEVALLGKAFWGDRSYYHGNSYTYFLVEQLLDNYMMQKAYAGEMLVFEEDLLPLLERCRQIGQELYRHDPAVDSTVSILQMIGSIRAEDYDFLSLRLNAGQPRLMQVYVNLYAVRADTPNPELCIELMEALCLNNWPQYNTCLYQDSAPLLDPQYGSRVTRMQALIEDTRYELAIDELEASRRAELESRLARQQANLTRLLEDEDERYLVTALDLAWFRAHTDCMFVQSPGVFSANNMETAEAYKALKTRFASGELSAAELVAELNRLASGKQN